MARHNHHTIGPAFYQNDFSDTKKLMYSLYIQFIIVFQGVLFFGPKFTSNFYENDVIKSILEGKSNYIWKVYLLLYVLLKMNFLGKPQIHNSVNMKKYAKEVAHFIAFCRGEFSGLTKGFLFSHILAILNLVLQLISTDFIFENLFTTEGFKVISYLSLSQEHRNDTLTSIFPHMVKVGL